MKTIEIILLAALGISGLVIVVLLVAFSWVIHKENRREEEQIRHQMEDDRFTAAYCDDHDVSGLLEED